MGVTVFGVHFASFFHMPSFRTGNTPNFPELKENSLSVFLLAAIGLQFSDMDDLKGRMKVMSRFHRPCLLQWYQIASDREVKSNWLMRRAGMSRPALVDSGRPMSSRRFSMSRGLSFHLKFF